MVCGMMSTAKSSGECTTTRISRRKSGYELLPPEDAVGQHCFDGGISFDGIGQSIVGDACAPVRTIGDMNCDGSLNSLDIDPFVLALTDPGNYVVQHPACVANNADCNCDGSLNSLDIDPLVAMLTGQGACLPAR